MTALDQPLGLRVRRLADHYLRRQRPPERLALGGQLRSPGPPPAELLAEIQATGKSLQRGGAILSILVVLIVIFMVTKPQF